MAKNSKMEFNSVYECVVDDDDGDNDVAQDHRWTETESSLLFHGKRIKID